MKQAMRGLLAATTLGAIALAVSLSAQGNVKVDLKDGQGQSIGTATLMPMGQGVHIMLDVKNLKPGPHGIHVHQVAKCEGPAFTSAGGHFNPGAKKHGTKNPDGPHAGDMDNFTVNADGTSKAQVMANGVSLGNGPNSVFANGGTALVIHAGPDDMMTDPSGNSGDRVACGVIEKK